MRRSFVLEPSGSPMAIARSDWRHRSYLVLTVPYLHNGLARRRCCCCCRYCDILPRSSALVFPSDAQVANIMLVMEGRSSSDPFPSPAVVVEIVGTGRSRRRHYWLPANAVSRVPDLAAEFPCRVLLIFEQLHRGPCSIAELYPPRTHRCKRRDQSSFPSIYTSSHSRDLSNAQPLHHL